LALLLGLLLLAGARGAQDPAPALGASLLASVTGVLALGLGRVLGALDGIRDRLDQQEVGQRSLRERLDELRSVSLDLAATQEATREPVSDEQVGRLLREGGITAPRGGESG